MATAQTPVAEPATAQQTQLVVFLLADEEYALPIDRVKEVVQYTPPRPVTSSDPRVTGVINLRGKITLVYDLAQQLGVTSTAPVEGRKIVVLESDQASSGLIVDDVCQVTTLSSGQLEQHTSADPSLITAIAKLEDHLVVLLNADGFAPDGQQLAAMA